MPIIAEDVIPTLFLPELAAFRDAIFTRMLPTFDSIESEAEQIEAEAFARLSAAADEYTDGAHLAEAALDAGLQHLGLMSGTRQAILNVLAVAIAHLFEQQRHLLSLRTLVDSEPDSRKRENSFRELLAKQGVDPTLFIHRAKLEELDLVANVAKHAEGQSAEKLRLVRPELFTHPLLRADSAFNSLPPGAVNRPLMGDDLYVQPEDLRAYLDAVEVFWRFVLHQLTAAP